MKNIYNRQFAPSSRKTSNILKRMIDNINLKNKTNKKAFTFSLKKAIPNNAVDPQLIQNKSTLHRSFELMNKGKGNPIQKNPVTLIYAGCSTESFDVATVIETQGSYAAIKVDKICIRTCFNKLADNFKTVMGNSQSLLDLDHWSFDLSINDKIPYKPSVRVSKTHATPSRFSADELNESAVKSHFYAQLAYMGDMSVTEGTGFCFFELFIPLQRHFFSPLKTNEEMVFSENKKSVTEIEKAYSDLINGGNLTFFDLCSTPAFKNGLIPKSKNVKFVRLSFIASLDEIEEVAAMDLSLMQTGENKALQLKQDDMDKMAILKLFKTSKNNISIYVAISVAKPKNNIKKKLRNGFYHIAELRGL